jgi:hypothetical protein
MAMRHNYNAMILIAAVLRRRILEASATQLSCPVAERSVAERVLDWRLKESII